MLRNYLAKLIIVYHRYAYRLAQGPFFLVVVGLSRDLLNWSLKKSSKFSYDDLRDLQNRRLRSLIRNAYFNVPFWRDRFDFEGLNYFDIKSIEDLKKIPILTKEDLRNATFKSIDYISTSTISKNKKIISMTTGSTGEPTIVVFDKLYPPITRHAFTLRTLSEVFGQAKKILVMNMTKELFDAPYLNNYFINVNFGNIKDVNSFINNFSKVSWDAILVAPLSSIISLTKLLGDRRNEIKLSGIVATDALAGRETRKNIEGVFRCPVFINYSSRETQTVGIECDRKDGFHHISETSFVEIVDENGQSLPIGEVGRIVVTNFNNYAMPFIRYHNGDVGRILPGPCGCGKNSPRIELLGRGMWQFIMPDGGKINYGSINDVIGNNPVFCAYFLNQIKQFQFVQENVNKVVLSIIPEKGHENSDFLWLYDLVKEKFFKDRIDFEIVTVDKIPPSNSRKPVEFVSKLTRDNVMPI